MPVPFGADHDKNTAKFQFLCNIPTLDITPSLQQDECVICKEPYRKTAWRPGTDVHRPVALPCGHVLGFQCLARWMLSSTSVNQCPFCRKQIVDPSRMTRERLSRPLASSLARLDMLPVLASNGLSQTQMSQLLWSLESSFKSEAAGGTRIDQIMAAWEELLSKYLRNASPAPAIVVPARQPVRVVVRRQQPGQNNQPIQNEHVSLVVHRHDFQAALFFSVAGLLYVPAKFVCDKYAFSRSDSLASSLESVLLWLICCWVPIAVAENQVPLKWKVVLPGALLGVVFAVLVAWVDVRLFEWWNRGKTVVEYTLY